MLALASGLNRCGARTRIVLPDGENSVKFKERCDEVGVECERSSLISASMQGTRQSLPSIVRLLRSIDSPIVHFHTGNSCLPRTVMASLELLRFRSSFVTLQSPYETITPGSARARFWATTARHRFSAVVSPSQHATAFQIRCGIPPELANTVRNSIDVRELASGDARGPRAMIGVAPDDPIVLFCSRIDDQKRPVEAVQVFGAIAEEFPTAVLVFVGKGDQEQAVRNEAARLGISDRVRLVGYQTNIPSWLAAASVWILPTERENFSVAVLEALGAGCAVLSTSCEGNDEVLVNGQNALTFPVGDVPAATKALRSLLRDPMLRGRLRDGALASAQHYAVAGMVEGYRQIYWRSRVAPDRLWASTGP
jgi:glycosyltransferase involved in cell wall biosynthesis